MYIDHLIQTACKQYHVQVYSRVLDAQLKGRSSRSKKINTLRYNHTKFDLCLPFLPCSVFAMPDPECGWSGMPFPPPSNLVPPPNPGAHPTTCRPPTPRPHPWQQWKSNIIHKMGCCWGSPDKQRGNVAPNELPILGHKDASVPTTHQPSSSIQRYQTNWPIVASHDMTSPTTPPITSSCRRDVGY